MTTQDPPNFGHLIEGVVEQDPMTDRYVIRTVDTKGKPVSFDVQEALAQFKGEEVRFTLTSFKNLAKLAEMVEAAGGSPVASITPEQLEVPFDIKKKN
jgi:hypothetical protein